MYIRKLIGVMFSLSVTSVAYSQEKTQCEIVKMAGIEIVCLEKGVGSFSAHERAAAILKRLDHLSHERTFDTEKIVATESENSSDVLAADSVLLSLRDEDLQSQNSLSRAELAQSVAAHMQSAIIADRTLRSPTQLLWGAGYSAIATIGLLLLFLLFSRVFPGIYKSILTSDGRYIRSLKIQSFELLNSSRIISLLLWIARAIRFFLTALALYIYVPLVLSFFPWTANWAPKLLKYIVDPLAKIFEVFIDYIPNVFFIIAIVMVTKYLLKFIHFFFIEIENGRLKFEGFYREWAAPTYKLVRVLIFAFAFIMCFPYLPGSSSPAFQGISVFLGVLLSLGSSSAVANIVAGVVLTYMRPFKEGDRVRISDTTGDVLEKTLLVTRIRTIKNVEITVPNAMVLGSHIINYSATAQADGLILNTTVTIGYDAPWRQVHELLKAAAKKTEYVSKDKEPFVLQTALNDFYVAYELNAYTSIPNKMAVIYSLLHQNIQDCFNEAGVEIMSPHYSSLRDGNETSIPSANRPANYEAPKFRT